MAGAPKGNQNSAKGREATKALFQALAVASGQKEPEDVLTRYQVLVEMWNKQIISALEGDKASLQMIVERTDGKPKQAIVGGDDDDQPIRISRIELVALSDNSED